MLSRLLNRLWPHSPRRARRAQPPRRRPALEALEDRCLLSGFVYEYPPLNPPGSNPVGITAGPDYNLWFTEPGTNHIGRIASIGGDVTVYGNLTSSSAPLDITAGPDGNLWFTESGANQIGRITPQGIVTEYPLHNTNSEPFGITAGPDGYLWFTEYKGNRIGRINPNVPDPGNTIAEYALRTPESRPSEIAAGLDGNLWFSEEGANALGHIDPRALDPGRTLTEIVLPANSGPGGITAGPDGNLWFTEGGTNQIGRMTPQGVLTGQFTVPTPASLPYRITAGSDGNLWFTEQQGNRIASITPAGSFNEFPPLAMAVSQPWGITPGPLGNLWFTEHGSNRIGEVDLFDSRTQMVLPPGFKELVGQLRVLPGVGGVLGGGRLRLRLRLINVGGALEGPLWLALTGLRRKVHLRHPSGLTTHLFPGSPFVELLPAGGVLPASGKLNVVLQFRAPAGVPVHFTPHLLGVDLGSLNPQPLPPEVQP
jgi:streptogramin lyase